MNQRRPPARRAAPAAPPPGSEAWSKPWVLLRSAARHPFIYRRMVRTASDDASPGDVVAVYDKAGMRFGTGFYNPRSQIAVRMVCFDDTPVDQAYFHERLATAVALRHEILGLPDRTNAYRVVHAEGDGLSGLIADRFDDVLSVQVFSLGVSRQLESWLPVLEKLLDTRKRHVDIDPHIAQIEGIKGAGGALERDVKSVRIHENGVRYAVDFERGHKTGFFCDQRENRALLATLVRGHDVLDLCCYTGGFAIVAKVAGEAADVTGVDLDERAIDQARHNANLNNARVRWVHADAFSWARQMRENDRRWGVVVVDPPKFIGSREEFDEGCRKYHDLNRLALGLVNAGGLMVTCSCSGLLQEPEFERTVFDAARREGRTLQVVNRTGAGGDHPVMANCPESRYLKVLWLRVL